MKNLFDNLVTSVLVATLLGVFGLLGCANEGAPGEGDDASLGGYYGGDAEGCVPCEPGTKAVGTDKWGNLCCGLTVGSGTYDPCHNNCGTGTVCDKVAAVCVAIACVDVADCDDGNACTTDTCDQATGCQYVNNNNACNDNNPCTTNDACNGGACEGGDATVCNDNNGCTTDTCDPTDGGCQYVNNNNACNDTDACTTNDTCNGGSCVGGAAPNCNDGNDCTADGCVAGVGCVNVDIQGCVPLPCDDGKVCTTDTVDPATGNCVYVNNSVACNDNNLCTTGDVCGAGVCAGVAVACSDGNNCTNDSCNPANGGCVYAPIPGCVPQPCDDGKVCTTDTVDPATGNCVYVNNSVACNDNNLCTTGDVCGAGVCAGAAVACDDSNGCTDDSCNPASGACVYAPVPGCVGVPEVCNNGLDDDKDGAIDCADADCGPGVGAYTLHVYAPGGSVSILPSGWATSLDYAVSPLDKDGNYQESTFTFFCGEIPFAVAVNGGANGPTQVWVQPLVPGGAVPDLWKFAVYVPWVGPPVLNPVGDPVLSKDFSVPGDGNFLVRYPALPIP